MVGRRTLNPVVKVRVLVPQLILVAALATSASSFAKPPSAGAFYKATIEQVFSGRFGAEWQTLHPAQRRFVTRARYIQCSDEVQLGKLAEIDILRDRAAPKRTIPGTDVSSTARAITYRITLADGGSETYTSRAYLVDGAWRWTMDLSAIAAFKAGRCPT